MSTAVATPPVSLAGNMWHVLRQTVAEFIEDNCLRLAAALSYYTALSLAPLLLIVIALAGLIFDDQAARNEVVGQLRNLIGPQGAEVVQTMLSTSRPENGGWFAGAVGLIVLLVGATGVFSQLQDALNAVWAVPEEKQKSGFWRSLKDRLLSFSMVCGLAFLVLVSLVLNALLSGLGSVLEARFGGASTLLTVANTAVAVLVTFVMFAMIFKVLPRANLKWSDVWIGAGLTTLLFTLGKYGIGVYLGQAAVGSTFGAAGSFVVLLTWLYYSSAILLFGAEFTHVYATRHGSAVGKSDRAITAGK